MTRFLLQNARTLTCVLVPFAKYHGLGNDFVIVDLRDADHSVVQAPFVLNNLRLSPVLAKAFFAIF